MNNMIKSIFEDVLNGDRDAVGAKVEAAVQSGIAPADILNNGLIAAMEEVGKLFEAGEYYVPEMLIAARAMQTGLNILKPRLVEQDVQPKGKIVIGTVKGDLHDIGKNLVAMMLEGAGYEVLDLGTDVSVEKFVAAVKENKPKLVGLSALLTTTMQNMKIIIDGLSEAGVRQQVKVMVGGAPVTEAFAKDAGADGFAPDASRAVALAKSLVV